jgi:hypothetical protein
MECDFGLRRILIVEGERRRVLASVWSRSEGARGAGRGVYHAEHGKQVKGERAVGG